MAQYSRYNALSQLLDIAGSSAQDGARTLTDETSGLASGYAPQRHAYGRSEWDWQPQWQISPQFNWVADRARAQGEDVLPNANRVASA